MWENKFKAQTSADKVMASFFCDNDGIVLVGDVAQAMQSDMCGHQISQSNEFEAFWQKKESESFSCKPYDPEVTTSDFHLFGPLKDALRGLRFAENEELRISQAADDRKYVQT